MQAFSSLWATHGCEHERECRVQLFAAPWTVACQTPLSVEFSRQAYWSGFPFYLPDPGIEPESLASPALAGRFLTTSASWETHQEIWDLTYHESAPLPPLYYCDSSFNIFSCKRYFLVGRFCFSFFPLIVVLQVLGWPKYSFWFFHTILWKTRINFLAKL